MSNTNIEKEKVNLPSSDRVKLSMKQIQQLIAKTQESIFDDNKFYDVSAMSQWCI